MKTKLVLWGTTAQNERVLIALELLPDNNKVKVFTFPENIATEEFSQLMLKEWRDGHPVEFPDGFSVEERELSLSGALLPEGVKAERDDIVQRAQTEWHFIVLSSKLYQTYQSEVSEYRDRIEKALRFDSSLWDELKTFWDKVQVQVRDKNLFREHADALRNKTNELFGQLKGLRSKLDEEFETISKENYERMSQQLVDLEKKIADGLRLQPIFEDLKEMQRKFRDAKLTKDHRAKVWDKLDKAFKSIKERRFGPNTSDDRPPVERLQRRYDGLMSAIDKMEKSIHRDDEELDFQKRKVEASEGQLEAQIRQAKIVMIEERIRSKREKLNEMTTTKVDLDRRMDSQREKEAKRMEQEKVDEAKRMAQDKIAQEIKAAASARETESDKLDKAAEAIKSEKQPKEADKPKEEAPAEPKGDSLLDAIGTTLGESLQGALDTALAVAQVAGEKLSDAVVDIVENISEKVQEAMKPTEAAEAPAAEEAAATTTAETTETVAEVTEKPATDAPTTTDEVKPTEEEEA
jgi:hypothetical protein